MNKPGRSALPAHATKVFDGVLFTVWQWEQELYDGSMATFERVRRADVASVLGVLPDRRILLVRDEQPDREPVVDVPGGKIEPGEEPAVAARREFLEETGYQIGDLVHWHTYRPSGKIEWQIYVYVGRDLHKLQEPHPEPGERIEPVPFTFEALLDYSQEDDGIRNPLLRIDLLRARFDAQRRQALYDAFYGTA